MATYDPRIDAYIAKSAAFAQPIMEHLRALVHEVCPDAEETLKWGMPCFDYKGILCSFAAFKQHCSFGFWKTAIMQDPHGVLVRGEDAGMGSLGKLTSMQDLPSDKILKSLIKEAVRLNDEGIKIPAVSRKTGAPKPEIAEPDYFSKALAKNKKAKETWAGFAPSHKREYLEWITGAKTEPTREKRLATTLQQLEEGKKHNWKYEMKK